MAKKDELAVPDTNTAVMAADFADELAADTGSGFESVKATDIAIPYYSILQALSPQVKKGEKKIDGAEEGDIFNTVSSEIIKGDDGIIIVPCVFDKKWVEWIPRDSGGGFVQAHSSSDILNECSPDKDGRPTLSNGNNIVDTAYHYVLRIMPNGSIERALIAMTSTQMKKSRRWLTNQMNLQLEVKGKMINPPPYSHSYHMTTIGESKNDNSWFGWNIRNPQLVESEIYRTAKEFAKDIIAGIVDITPPPETDSGTAEPEKAKHDNF